MNPLELIEKLINEHGSATVLREHLGLLKAQQAALKARCRDLQAQNAQLQRRIEQHERHIHAAEEELHALRGGDVFAQVCAQCGAGGLRRTGTRPHPTFGRLGLKEAVFRCDRCDTDTFFEIPVTA